MNLIGDLKTAASENTSLIKLSVKRLDENVFIMYRLSGHKDTYIYGQRYYTISVTKITSGGSRREISTVRDVSRNIDEAERIFDAVCRGRVTPCTLYDVIYDMISQ